MRALLLVLLLLGQQAGKPNPKEPPLRKSLGEILGTLAQWCADHRLMDEGRAFADEALGIDPDAAKAKAAKPLLTGDSSGATDADRKEYEAKLAESAKKAADLYRQLYQIPHVGFEPKYDPYLARALELDPKSIQPFYDGEWKAALGRSQWKHLHTLLSKEEEVLGPDTARSKAMREAEVRISPTEPILKKASKHDLKYFISLPKNWNDKQTWYVVIHVEGAGSDFEIRIKDAIASRTTQPCIFVVPCGFCNTNKIDPLKYPMYPAKLLDEVDKKRLEWDDAGVLNVLEDLKRDYKADDRFFISGFSGGGILTWYNILKRPERLMAASPACGNYTTYKDVTKPEKGLDVPIKAFQGEKDEFLGALNLQWTNGERQLKDWGYTNVSRVMVPGAGHVPMHQQVMEFFTPLMVITPKK